MRLPLSYKLPLLAHLVRVFRPTWFHKRKRFEAPRGGIGGSSANGARRFARTLDRPAGAGLRQDWIHIASTCEAIVIRVPTGTQILPRYSAAPPHASWHRAAIGRRRSLHLTDERRYVLCYHRQTAAIRTSTTREFLNGTSMATGRVAQTLEKIAWSRGECAPHRRNQWNQVGAYACGVEFRRGICERFPRR